MRQRVGPPADKTDEAPLPAPANVRSIRVTWGEEVHQPIQYNGFRVGAIEVLVDVLPAEDVREVYERTFAWLEELGRDQFRRKLDGFLTRVAEASTTTKRQSSPIRG